MASLNHEHLWSSTFFLSLWWAEDGLKEDRILEIALRRFPVFALKEAGWWWYSVVCRYLIIYLSLWLRKLEHFVSLLPSHDSSLSFQSSHSLSSLYWTYRYPWLTRFLISRSSWYFQAISHVWRLSFPHCHLFFANQPQEEHVFRWLFWFQWSSQWFIFAWHWFCCLLALGLSFMSFFADLFCTIPLLLFTAWTFHYFFCCRPLLFW